jgi:hypothetical protein
LCQAPILEFGVRRGERRHSTTRLILQLQILPAMMSDADKDYGNRAGTGRRQRTAAPGAGR